MIAEGEKSQELLKAQVRNVDEMKAKVDEQIKHLQDKVNVVAYG